MRDVFWLLVIALLLNVFVRHGGNFGRAWAEIVGFVSGLYSAHFARGLRSGLTWARAHWFALLILVISLIVIITQFLIPMMAPKMEQLQWGRNELKDKCGGTVVVWILPNEGDSEPGRLEIFVPRDTGRTINLLAPGADAAECTRLYTVTQ